MAELGNTAIETAYPPIFVTPYAAMNRELGVFKWGQDKLDWSGKIQGRGLWTLGDDCRRSGHERVGRVPLRCVAERPNLSRNAAGVAELA